MIADKIIGGNSMLRFITALVIVFAATFGVANAQSDLVKRGDYLVNGILTCGNCHTPKGPTGDIMDKAFSGGLSWDEPPFKVTAPNITQDNETGIGNYTDAELKQLLRKGIKRNGVPVAMIMPSGFYEIMTDRDLDAVIAYLRNIKSSKEKGIGGWTNEEIKRAITQGVSRDGSKLKPPMGYHYYSTISTDDLDAIVAYLRTVPAKE